MKSAKDFIGTEVYSNGKNIGRITDIIFDVRNKKIKGLTCVSNLGIIRSRFYVPENGVIILDPKGTLVDKDKIEYKKSFYEEYSDFGISKNSDYGYNSLGDIFVDPENRKILSVSIKKGFIDDLIFGREIKDISDISLTNKGQIIINENRR